MSSRLKPCCYQKNSTHGSGKADAYGHGALTVAQVALQSGASWLGVATVPEGIELRTAGIQAPIMVMGAINSTEEMQAVAHWRLQPTLVMPKQALMFSDALSHGDDRIPPPAGPPQARHRHVAIRVSLEQCGRICKIRAPTPPHRNL